MDIGLFLLSLGEGSGTNSFSRLSDDSQQKNKGMESEDEGWGGMAADLAFQEEEEEEEESCSFANVSGVQEDDVEADEEDLDNFLLRVYTGKISDEVEEDVSHKARCVFLFRM